MNHVFRFRNVNEALPVLCEALLEEGEDDNSRAGKTKELTHVGISLTHPKEREITLKSRKASLVSQIAETMWVLSGRNDIGWLKSYLPRATEFSDDGLTWRAGYGPRLRTWPRRDGSEDVIDQIAYVVGLMKKDPGTRRAVITLYDPQVDDAPGKDIPCNDWLCFLRRGDALDLHVAIRSNDLIWGWSGINQFEWSVLQEVVASAVGAEVGELHFSIVSLHLYERHWERAREIAQEQPPAPVSGPSLLPGTCLESFYTRLQAAMTLEHCVRADVGIDYSINYVEDPLIRHWMRELQDHWRKPLTTVSLAEQIAELHTEKDAAYGDSWRKHGELFSIIPNIARKVDRLGNSSTRDETSVDTAVDLLVYLVKYWDLLTQPEPTVDNVNAILRDLGTTETADNVQMLEASLKEELTELQSFAESHETQSILNMLPDMIDDANLLAHTLWRNSGQAAL
jgi:thymidylate synthase